MDTFPQPEASASGIKKRRLKGRKKKKSASRSSDAKVARQLPFQGSKRGSLAGLEEHPPVEAKPWRLKPKGKSTTPTQPLFMRLGALVIGIVSGIAEVSVLQPAGDALPSSVREPLQMAVTQNLPLCGEHRSVTEGLSGDKEEAGQGMEGCHSVEDFPAFLWKFMVNLQQVLSKEKKHAEA